MLQALSIFLLTSTEICAIKHTNWVAPVSIIQEAVMQLLQRGVQPELARDPGFYFVRCSPPEGWIVAEWRGDRWFVCGDEAEELDSAFEQIGMRVQIEDAHVFEAARRCINIPAASHDRVGMAMVLYLQRQMTVIQTLAHLKCAEH